MRACRGQTETVQLIMDRLPASAQAEVVGSAAGST